MRYITEQELRDAFSKGVPAHYEVPREARLTPAARQYLIDNRLYRQPTSGESGPMRTAATTKPEHMTNLDATRLVAKTHPRIALRGKLDSLEADILLVQATAAERGDAALLAPLQDALVLTRRILAAEVTGKALGEWTLNGMSPEQVHAASHNPKQYGFGGHVMPDAAQGVAAAQLNRLRTAARETELAAAAAFCDAEGVCARVDLLLALNRLSSYFYVLQLEAIRRREG